MTRRAVVTGGAGGLGRAVVEALRVDHEVTVLDVQGEGPHVDLTDTHAVQRAFAELGTVDVLVNAAGLAPTYGPAADLDLAAVRRALEVNLLAAWSCAQAVLPEMRDRRYGRIVNVTSVMASGGWRMRSDYAVTKAALRSLTETLAVENGAAGVTVNAVAAGHMRTPMTEPAGQSIDWSQIVSRIPLGRLVTTNEVAAAIAFLASERAAAINGATLVVDGGYLAHRYPN